jgi:signal transduction histidine kinase
VNMIQEQCNHKGLTLGRQIPAEPVVILGEPAKLRQILLNLLSNAMKFTPAGGSVQVSLTVEAEGHPMLAVSDSGIGMRPEDISIALTPFGQIDSGVARSYDGTGLGLPLAKAFTELHGASFEIVSQLGEGTTVSLHFIGAGSDDPQEHAPAFLIGAAAPGPHPLTVDQMVEPEIADSIGT